MVRVLHGPVNVGNQAWVLSRHERRLGVQSELVVSGSTWLDYKADRCFGNGRLDTARRLLFGITAPLRYDVLHYYFGQSFLGSSGRSRKARALALGELRLAKLLGRKIFMTLQGCDVRLSNVSAARNVVTPCQLGKCAAAPDCRASGDAHRRWLIENVLPLVDRTFVLNPELVSYVPGGVFMPYASVDVEAFEPIHPGTDGPAVILHAPSDESIKGSALIVAAVERLRRHFPIELVLVKGMRHEEALKQYRRADLVIDQVLAGWYGGFAVEAMAMGKPVACYIRDEDLGHLPPGMAHDLPFVRLTPGTLEENLAEALRQRRQWPDWGRKARAYVLRWHHPLRLARAMLRAYLDSASAFDLGKESHACAA